jgi:hypothetical protein
MATVATAKARQNLASQNRYIDSYWVNWTNELLEILSLEGSLPQVRKEVGLEVESDIYVNIPSDCIDVIDIFSPTNSEDRFPWERVEGRAKLLTATVESDDSYLYAGSIIGYSTDVFVVPDMNIADDTLKDIPDFR